MMVTQGPFVNLEDFIYICEQYQPIVLTKYYTTPEDLRKGIEITWENMIEAV